MVTSLVFEYDMDVSNYIDCFKTPRLKEEYFLIFNKLLTYLDI